MHMEARKVVLAEKAKKEQQQQLTENMGVFRKCPLNSHLGLIAVMPVSNEDLK